MQKEIFYDFIPLNVRGNTSPRLAKNQISTILVLKIPRLTDWMDKSAGNRAKGKMRNKNPHDLAAKQVSRDVRPVRLVRQKFAETVGDQRR